MKPRIVSFLLMLIGICFSWDGVAVAENETFMITSGTTLEVLVYKDEELSRKYLVDAAGTIDMPLVGRVKVGGLTVPQATDEIEGKLVKFIKKPQVNIYVRGYGNVYVLGEVIKPGPIQLSGRMYVLDAVGMAGGLKPTASGNRIKVIRKQADDQSKVIRIKLKKVMKGDMSKDVLLKPGDVIMVPERIF